MNYKQIFDESVSLGLSPMQEGEILFAMETIVNTIGDRSSGFIEVGSASGGSFFCWANIFDGPAISIDLPHIIGVQSDAVIRRNNTWDAHFSNRVHVIEENSMHVENVQRSLDEILQGAQVDFLFIDANHDYGPTESDHLNYKKYVRSGGMIGFHDIYHPGHLDGCVKYFNELVGEKLLSPTNISGCGLGLLRVT